MKRALSVLILVIFASMVSGCILNSTPKGQNVVVKVGESQTFTVTTFTGSTYFDLDGTRVQAGFGSKTFSYTYTPTEADSDTTHVLEVSNIVPKVSPETRTWYITVPAHTPAVIFSDNFDDGVIDPAKWIVGPGNRTVEEDEILKMEQLTTDFGGGITSKTILVNPFNPITV